MAAYSLAAANFSIVKQKKLEDGRRIVEANILMGDGASTYPAGGLAVAGKYLACPTKIDSLKVIDAAAQGINYSWDATNKKIRGFVTASHAHDVLLKNAAVADGATTRVNAGANLLGANTGGDLTVTGAGANGGVVLKTDAPNSEASAAFVMPVHTVMVEVIGY